MNTESMNNKNALSPAESLLKRWCDTLLKHQVRGYGALQDGGFLCDACTLLHGRADNAILPLMLMYRISGEEKYAAGAEAAFYFSLRFREPDGALRNDSAHPWKGITVFSALCILKTLEHFSRLLSDTLREELRRELRISADWVSRTIHPGFQTNINYYAAGADCLIGCGKYYGEDAWTEAGKELLSYCMAHFSENGLLYGEGFPHDVRSASGCVPVDIGYDMEESLPCLADAALRLQDRSLLRKLAGYAHAMLDFMLPDGAIDNSFGTRNNKWTWYGSRTSDGMLPLFAALAPYDPQLLPAAAKHLTLLEKCTPDGSLCGGPRYHKLGQKPCIHHTFSHAAGLAEAILLGFRGDEAEARVPVITGEAVKYYPELRLYRIRFGRFVAAITAYDYRYGTYTDGAAHCSGGTLSLLYDCKTGPVIAGSVLDYRLTEPFNMQLPEGPLSHRPLILRAELFEYGTLYSTCIDPAAEIITEEYPDRLIFRTRSRFVRISDWRAADEALTLETVYEFTEDRLQMRFSLSDYSREVLLHIPVIADSLPFSADRAYTAVPCFCLSPGFDAVDHILPLDRPLTASLGTGSE